MVGNYYSVINEYHSDTTTFEYCINWNVSEISSEEHASGYIVQHFRRKSTPQNFLIDDTDYWEAWKVNNGINVDRGSVCDDTFAVRIELADAFRKSLRTRGRYDLNGDVYWVPSSSEIFTTIDSWSTTTVHGACGLKASYEKPVGIDSYFVFSRPQFSHSWSLVDDSEIRERVLTTYLRYCPKYTNRDIDIITCNLNHIFSDKDKNLQSIKCWIFQEWKRIRSNEQ